MILNNKILSFAALSLLLLLCSCEEHITSSRGDLPDKDIIENTYGFLRSNQSVKNEVRISFTENTGNKTDNLYYQYTKSANSPIDLEMKIDDQSTNSENNVKLLPEENYDFPDGKILNISNGNKKSDSKRIRFFSKNLKPGEYILPVSVGGTEFAYNKFQTINYRISVRARSLGDYDLDTQGPMVVFYLNTSKYDPRLANDFYMQTMDAMTWEELTYKTIGNIVNLRIVQLKYDETTHRAILSLSPDIRHVLEGADTYIRPLQDRNRKVCLCIEGSGQGFGFCNMTDVQIDDFVAQVKTCVEMYGLDGVNLWDRNSAYDKAAENGHPDMNTTSYPKLIKRLHEELNPLGKIVTLVDFEQPTEYFYEDTQCGGIKVGEYIDYAWSGYCDNSKQYQIVDPYHQGQDYVSTIYPRKPIAGLKPQNYGCINVPWYKDPALYIDNYKYEVFKWRNLEYKQSNILVFEDLRSNIQDEYEGIWDSEIVEIYKNFCDNGIYEATFYPGVDEWDPGYWDTPVHVEYSFVGEFHNPNDPSGYNKWLKDW